MMLQRTLRAMVGTVFCALVFLSVAQFAQAQSTAVLPATVIDAGAVVSQEAYGLSKGTFTQDVIARMKDGDATKVVSFPNDFAPLKIGDRIYLRATRDGDETFYSVYDIDRRWPLVVLGVVFATVIVIFGGRSGLRSLLSLIVSIVVIIYVLMPLIASGRSPLLWGMVIAVALLALVMGFTHGLRPKTYAAFLGTSIAVAITGVLAVIVTKAMAFSGIGTEDAFFLSTSRASIDMASLLLTGIIIGMLGVLDDVAITQAAVVMELKRAGVRGVRALYARAMVIGHEHVGALINTLVLAYAGASLPLFLLLATYNEPFGAVISIELVSVEIVRSLVGSIGLILAVPITTFLATSFTARDQEDVSALCAHGHQH